MQSFRTEIENPIVAKDILALEAKIHEFKEGKLDEENSVACVWQGGFMGKDNPVFK